MISWNSCGWIPKTTTPRVTTPLTWAFFLCFNLDEHNSRRLRLGSCSSVHVHSASFSWHCVWDRL